MGRLADLQALLRTAGAITLGALATLLVVWLATTASEVLLWALIASVLAMAADHGVRPVSRALPHLLSSVLIWLIGVVLALGATALIVTLVVAQITDLVHSLPALVDKAKNGHGTLGYLEDHFQIVERVNDAVHGMNASKVAGLGGSLVSVGSTAAHMALGLFSVAFLTLFMLIYGPGWKDVLIHAAGHDRGPLGQRVADAIRHAAGGWVLGAIGVAIPAAIASFIVLEILGADYPLALAAIVFVGDPIPFVGVTVASLACALILLAEQGTGAALIFIGFMVVYQQVVENHLIVPVVYGRSVQLSALAILLSVLTGGALAGVVGALLAIPIAGAAKAAFLEVVAWRGERNTATGVELRAAEALAKGVPEDDGGCDDPEARLRRDEDRGHGVAGHGGASRGLRVTHGGHQDG